MLDNSLKVTRNLRFMYLISVDFFQRMNFRPIGWRFCVRFVSAYVIRTPVPTVPIGLGVHYKRYNQCRYHYC
ncbi:uncharacterized protein CANTADRAFT_323424 [Suhomyces tanzawaensis NRRL Y-17324]|uniref:Uncharacterized protein n=1 Tax=Suhomyces tanzawaensis NRRL Y-17324 TaxID=984487 RepID=A0A1E4SC13_9ASCO|nr:uncharacterized protein CANTADRAFT_323424 [Suhomyces tanzawaensis NRRL Y-17324]ODV77041.1 hypothetical protein CANTADRAFT_323424 [Suhomyces tanzawaensis NRRL Y-17324]